MVKHYILRGSLYDEETRLEFGISQQVCVDVFYFNKSTNLYKTHRVGKLLIQDEIFEKNVKLKSFEKLIIYVKDELLALVLATRWINESKQKTKGYQIIGIDRYYSVFD